MNKSILNSMIEELVAVLDKYRETYVINYCEVIGALEIISRDIYSEVCEISEESENEI